jgi:hypothetical protein
MTAIQWIESDVEKLVKDEHRIELFTLFQKAIMWEREQIVDAYSHGWHDGQDVIIAQVKHIDKGGEVAGNEYYNETKGGAK